MQYKRIGQTDMMASEIGFGASAFEKFYSDSSFALNDESREKAKLLVKQALDLGINYFDTAPWYGNSEYFLGIGLQGHPRSTYYLATKIGRYNLNKPETEWFDFSYQRTIESVENSLKLFGTDYLDLVQVHDFEFLGDDLSILVKETLPALDFLRKSGKIKYIGINTYIIQKLKDLLEISPVKIDTVLTFCHYSLVDDSLKDYVDYFRSKGVGIINAAPLAMGLITRQGPPEWNLVSETVKEAVKKAFEYCDLKGVDLTKLAIHFSVKTDKADVMLVSMGSSQLINFNVKACGELSDTEKQAMHEIREKFFKPLGYTGYGDTDVKKYQNAIKSLRSNSS